MSKSVKKPLISVLDLVGMRPEDTAGEAIARSVATAQHVERLGYKRFWLAEHHSIAGLACSATAVLIGHVAGATSSIRVGSGGVMLPNHAPLVVAEQFGTLESIYPGRIDLGLGRAPGSDAPTMHALRRDLHSTGDDFPQLLAELQRYLGPDRGPHTVRAVPGQGTNVPITLLGSSGYSAQLAGRLGLPFAFAAHFAPEYLVPAVHLYRQNFTPSSILSEPYVMVGVPIIAADTQAKADLLFTTSQQRFLSLIRNQPVELKAPVDSMRGRWNEVEEQAVHGRLSRAIVGDQDAVARGISDLVDETGANELLVVTDTFGQTDRLRSYELVANAVAQVEQLSYV